MRQQCEEIRQTKFSLEELFQWTRVIYFNVTILSLIASYYLDQSFFIVFLIIFLLDKSIMLLLAFLKHKNSSEESDFFIIIVSTIVNFDCLKKEHTEYTYFTIFVYDALMIWYLFFSGRIYELENSIFAWVFLIQILLGLFYKSIVVLFMLNYFEWFDINFITVLQIFTLLLGTVSIQGIGFFLLQNFYLCLYIALWKLSLSILEIAIIIKNKMPLFGTNPNEIPQVISLCLALNLSYLPIDYAPIYDNDKLLYTYLDYKFVKLLTQGSMTLIKSGLMIDLLVMMVLVHKYDLVEKDQYIAYRFYLIVMICIVVYSCLQAYHITNRVYSHLTNNYTYFYSPQTSLAKCKEVIKNSKQARLIEISLVEDFENLYYGSTHSEKYSKDRKEIFDSIVNINDYEEQIISIHQALICKTNKRWLTFSYAYFVDEILSHIASERNLKLFQIHPHAQDQKQLDFQKAILTRLFTYGNSQKLEQFIDIQGKRESFQLMYQTFLSEFLMFQLFCKDIKPYLQTNPQEVYYDLIGSFSQA